MRKTNQSASFIELHMKANVSNIQLLEYSIQHEEHSEGHHIGATSIVRPSLNVRREEYIWICNCSFGRPLYQNLSIVLQQIFC